MKNRFKPLTRIRVWFYWHFGGIVIDGTALHPAFKPERVTNKVWFGKYEYYCNHVKQCAVEQMVGTEKFLNMTMAEIKNTLM